MKTNVDLIGNNGRVTGEVAGYMMQAGRIDPGMLRPWIGNDGRVYATVYKGSGDPTSPKNYRKIPLQTNATLRRDEWKQLDTAIMGVRDYRLGGVQDLLSKGLTYNLGNAMGTTVLEWHDVSDAMEAVVTMDGITRGPNDRPNFQFNYIPIPIIHVDFEINARVLEASRRLGNPLDTTSAERAARRVNEMLETMLFTDTDYSFGEKDDRNRNTIYSYVNHPDRNQVTLATYGSWDASATVHGKIIESVLAMKQSSLNARFYGPWMLYIPPNYETCIDEDYDTTTPGTTIRERIAKISGISEIKVIDTLADDNVLLVQMTPDVVRLIRGMDIQSVEWSEEGKMVTKYKVMTIQVPQIRSDQAGNCGIVHMA